MYDMVTRVYYSIPFISGWLSRDKSWKEPQQVRTRFIIAALKEVLRVSLINILH